MTQNAHPAAGLPLPSPKERRRLREAGGLGHEEIAEAVGVTASTVRSWEAGRTEPRGRKREAYAHFLVSLADPPPSPPPSAAGSGAAGPGTDGPPA
ncbi:helix-turn-helix domain-containing protein, partial [Streptomyces bambusae]|uniref:helix-turn-helix domain-containing protein n=1 Tax=Streptomyces bambusae TaxID=1550616 RepID=UPI001CFFAAEA